MAHSTPSSALDSLLSQRPAGMHGDSERHTACCCGLSQCAHLERNDAAMKELEQDLVNAAQIGQALLARHEAYMADAEAERRRMSASLENLEVEKEKLETTNANTIRENRRLLDELERLNGTLSDAESEIQSLTITLHSTMQEVSRLDGLTAQAVRLEQQLLKLETEHMGLQQQFTSKVDDERSANQRWRRAELTVTALQEQLERIEKEAAEERARHAEVVARFERRRAIEVQLEGAVDHPNDGTVQRGKTEESNKTVVSDFVKEILQDNANLQMGVLELRDMLMGSNEEVQNLREQMMLHQPLADRKDKAATPAQSLGGELAKLPGREVPSDVHVHHHYHAAPKVNTGPEKSMAPRRTKKRRNGAQTTFSVSNSGVQTPRISNQTGAQPYQPFQPAALNTILSHTSVSIPPTPRSTHAHKWSTSQAPSSTTASSLPNSPMFDRMEDFLSYSRPTTPESSYMGSPVLTPQQIEKVPDLPAAGTYRRNERQSISRVLSDAESDRSKPEYEDHAFPLFDHGAIPEEPEDNESGRETPVVNDNTAPAGEQSTYHSQLLIKPTLHRASSHESLLSTHGFAPPKVRSQPSQRLLSGPRPSLGTATASTGPIAGATWAVAHQSKSFRKYDSSSNFNKLLSAGNMSTSPPTKTAPSTNATFGKRVGGWIAGRWGMVPVSSVLAAPISTEGLSDAPIKSKGKEPEKRAARLSTHTEPKIIDESLLRDTLGEDSRSDIGSNVLQASTLKQDTQVPGNAAQIQRKAESSSTFTSTNHATVSGPAEPKPKSKPASQKGNRNSIHVEAVEIDNQLLAESLQEI